MKKLTTFFFFSILIINIGCIKDNVNPINLPITVTYTITASANKGGSIDPIGITSVIAGKTITYTIKPDIYKKFKVMVDGVSVTDFLTDIYKYEVKNVSSDKKIDVVFTSVVYTTTATTSIGGTIDPIGVTSVEVGNSVTYNIKPDANYSIKSIKVDGVDIPVCVTYEFINVSKNRSISAEFISTKVLLLTKAPWFLKSVKYIQNGVVVEEPFLNDEKKSDLYYFKVDGKTISNHSNGQQTGSSNWYFLNNESRFLNGDQNYSFLLTEKEFICSKESSYNGIPAILEYLYWRP